MKSTSANATVLDSLDALCFILCESSEEDDQELVSTISNAISHICFSCDSGAFETLGDAGDGYKISGAVLTHVFQLLKDHVSDNLYDRRLRAVYSQLLSTMVHRFGVLSDQARAGWKSTETFLSCFDYIQIDLKPWCTSMLSDLVDTSRSDALHVTTDVLCALLISGSNWISSFLSENLCSVLFALQKATSIDHREKLLSLILLVVSSPKHKGDANDSQNCRPKRESPEDSKSAISGAMLAEALKPCLISPSSVVRSLVADIVTILQDRRFETTFSTCTRSLFASASGFTDYLIESIRRPFKYSTPDSLDYNGGDSSSPESDLAVPMLRILAQITARFPHEMRPKWGYALPVVCKSALIGYNNDATEATFKVFAKSCSLWSVLQKDLALDIVQLFLRSGGRLRSTLDAESMDFKPEKSCFTAGIDMLSELTENSCLPASISAELLECAECIGVLCPDVENGSKFTDKVLRLVLEGSLTSDLAASVKTVAIDVWGSHLANLFSKPSSASTEQMVHGLNILCAALDMRLYQSEFELHEVALPLFREINFAKVSAVLTQEHQSGEVESDCGVGSSDALWNSLDQNLHPESNEGSPTRHTGNIVNGPLDADAARAYFGRIICSLPNVSDDLGLKSALSYRVLVRSMPRNVTALISQLSSPATPEKLQVAMNVLLASIVHSQSTIAYPNTIQKALLGCAESASMSEASFRECALPLVRLNFLCSDRMQEAGNDVFIPKAVCAIALKHEGLDIAGLDSDLFFHVLSKHDTELRVLAWNAFARGRVHGDPRWNAIDSRLADLLGESTSASKNFVTSCLEGSHELRCIALDLMALRPVRVPTALLKVGLPSLIMKELEARTVLLSCPDSARRSLEEFERAELRLRDLIAIVTMAVKYGEQEDLHRMLMMLIDAYERGNDSTSLPKKVKNTTLDGAIVRCLISALNALAEPNRDQALVASASTAPYLMQTSSVSKMKEQFASAVGRILDDGSCSSVEWSDDDEFELQSVACALDYVTRHQTRTFLANPSCDEAKITTSSSLSGLIERDWIVLLFHCRVGTGHHARNCRQASCMKLLSTIVVHCISCKSNLDQTRLGRILGPALLASTVAAAATPQGVLQSSALDFLLILVTYEGDLFENAELRLSNLASHKAFYSLVAAKFAISPKGLTLVELRYLASYSFRRFAPTGIKRALLMKNVANFSAIIEVSGEKEDALYKAAKTLIGGAATSRSLSSNDAVSAFHGFVTALESASIRHRGIIDQAEAAQVLYWNQDELLIGSRAILAAPLSFPLPTAQDDSQSKLC